MGTDENMDRKGEMEEMMLDDGIYGDKNTGRSLLI